MARRHADLFGPWGRAGLALALALNLGTAAAGAGEGTPGEPAGRSTVSVQTDKVYYELPQWCVGMKLTALPPEQPDNVDTGEWNPRNCLDWADCLASAYGADKIRLFEFYNEPACTATAREPPG